MKLMDLIKRGRPEAAITATDTDPARADLPEVPAPAQGNQEEALTMKPAENPVGSTASAAPTPAAPPSPPVTAATAPPAPPAGPIAASFAELHAEFADDPAFVCDCLKQGRTLSEAHKAYNAKLRAENANLRALGNAGKGGASPVTTSPAASGEAGGGELTGDEYEREVKRVMAADKIAYPLAIAKVNKEKPELRVAYIERSRRLQHSPRR